MQRAGDDVVTIKRPDRLSSPCVVAVDLLRRHLPRGHGGPLRAGQRRRVRPAVLVAPDPLSI
jgi:hypothetical protein